MKNKRFKNHVIIIYIYIYLLDMVIIINLSREVVAVLIIELKELTQRRRKKTESRID